MVIIENVAEDAVGIAEDIVDYSQLCESLTCEH